VGVKDEKPVMHHGTYGFRDVCQQSANQCLGFTTMFREVDSQDTPMEDPWAIADEKRRRVRRKTRCFGRKGLSRAGDDPQIWRGLEEVVIGDPLDS